MRRICKALGDGVTDNNYCIALQPICDGQMFHVADELLYRSSVTAQFAQVDDAVQATARVCNAAFYEHGLEQLVGSRKLFFNAPRDWLLKPDLLPPHPDQVVVEVLESVRGEPEILNALTEIRQRGFQVALDDFVLNAETEPLLALANIIKVDISQPFRIEDIERYQRSGLTLLAERVEDLETFRHFRELGFEYFQGYFYARAEVRAATSRQRQNNQSAQLRILAELQQDEPDYRQLESLIVQDPHLTFLLLKYTNSALFRRLTEVTTISQALSLLGINRIRSIVTTVMLAHNGPCNRLLLPQILTRACMCEKLAEGVRGLDPRTAFMAGLMSGMDLLMNMSLPELVNELPLSPLLKGALIAREGRLGKMLDLLFAFEQARLSEASPKVVERLNQIWMVSQVEANKMLSEVA